MVNLFDDTVCPDSKKNSYIILRNQVNSSQTGISDYGSSKENGLFILEKELLFYRNGYDLSEKGMAHGKRGMALQEKSMAQRHSKRA